MKHAQITVLIGLLVLQLGPVALLWQQRSEQDELKQELQGMKEELALGQTACIEQLAALQRFDGRFTRLDDRLARSSKLCEKAVRTGAGPTLSVRHAPETKKIDPESLSRVWIMPHPPLNRGRFLTFESYTTRKNSDGSETVIFLEWNGSSLEKTEIPASEVRWNVGR